MIQKFKILLGLTIVTAVLLWYAFSLFGPHFKVWKHIPNARSWRFQEVLSDDSLIGLDSEGILSKLGSPGRIEGPYSWWSLIDLSLEEELSSLRFDYDESLNVTSIALTENRSPESKPLPLNLQAYRNEAPEVRHRMNLTLVTLSKADQLPAGLSTIHDVEKFFPRARFVENWYYYAGLADGSIVVGFDNKGKVKGVWDDW